MTRPTSFVVVMLLTICCPSAFAGATPADVTKAQKLVRQAAALEQRGDLTGALDALGQAAAIDPEPRVVLALAKVRLKLGHLVEAREALTSVVYAAAPPEGAPGAGARAEAEQMFSELGSRIPRIRLVADAGSMRVPLRVTLDGEALPAGAERLPLPVDPGRHVLVVGAPGMHAQTVPFEAVESAERTVIVHLVAAAPPAPAPVAPPLDAPHTALSGVVVAPPVAPAALDHDDRLAAARRAKFSVGRFFLESLSSAVVGSLAAYGTFKATCGDQPCLGGGLGSLGVNVVVTPLTVWGVGEATGGAGGFGWALLGGLVAFSGYTAGTTDPTLPLVIGVVLMPFTSALMYELSSNTNAQRALRSGTALAPTFAPLVGPSNGVVGAVGAIGGRF